jgi:hypothetical protein
MLGVTRPALAELSPVESVLVEGDRWRVRAVDGHIDEGVTLRWSAGMGLLCWFVEERRCLGGEERPVLSVDETKLLIISRAVSTLLDQKLLNSVSQIPFGVAVPALRDSDPERRPKGAQ